MLCVCVWRIFCPMPQGGVHLLRTVFTHPVTVSGPARGQHPLSDLFTPPPAESRCRNHPVPTPGPTASKEGPSVPARTPTGSYWPPTAKGYWHLGTGVCRHAVATMPYPCQGALATGRPGAHAFLESACPGVSQHPPIDNCVMPGSSVRPPSLRLLFCKMGVIDRGEG